MDGRVPGNTWAIIEGRSADECLQFKAEVGLSDTRVMVDPGGRIADKLKTHMFPSAIVFVDGKPRSAKSIPSYRQFRQICEDPTRFAYSEVM